ncbi:MAG: FtsX-like permease family protein [Candidatus Bathyarchaeia archaeon]
MPRKPFRLCALLVLLVFACFPSSLPVFGQEAIDFRPILDAVQMDRIRSDVEAFTSMPDAETPSRFTGSPGFWMAADYIKAQLANYGYTPLEETVTITVPVDDGGELQVLSVEGGSARTLKAYPLVPNTVNPSVTPREGITGRLIYGGGALLAEMAGKEVEGNIVLLEYNSRWYWKNAAMLGAKGIVFIEPQDSTQVESLGKSLGIPAPIPRVLVRRSDGLWLRDLIAREGPVEVRLNSRMHWENLQVPNIVAVKEGTVAPHEFILVAVPYDSYSVVPSLAPGATAAVNLATALEIARLFSEPQFAPTRSVKFVFLAGHGQGLAGAREFVDSHFYEIGSIIKMMVGIDLSYDSPQLGIYAKGSIYQYRTSVEGRRFPWVNDRVIEVYVRAMREQTGRPYRVLSAMFPTEPISDPNPMMFDTDPYTLAGGIGMMFHTTNALRQREKTPKDLPEFIDYATLQPQVEMVVGCIYGFAQESTLLVSSAPERLAADGGFAIIEGNVGLYNLTTAWYDPFENPDAIVHVQWNLAFQASQVQFAGEAIREPPTFDIYIKPDASGAFVVKGVKPYSAVRQEAYVVDPEDSRVLYATDFGIYGLGKGYPTPPPTAQTPGGAYTWITDEVTKIWLPVFRCGSLVLFSLMDPSTASITAIGVQNYNFLAHSWNLQHSEDVKGAEVMAFIPVGIPTELIVMMGTTTYPLAILSNMTREHPTGSGYTASHGETLFITYTPYVVAQQLILLTGSRIDLMAARNTFSAEIEDYHPRALQRMAVAEAAFNAKEWDVAIAAATSAWAYERTAYKASMSLIIDVISTVVFFFLLMMPFSLLLQKLVSPRLEGLRRVFGFLIIFLIAVATLYAFHPGFHIAFNVFMIMIAAGVAVLSFAVILNVSGGASEATKAQQVKALGLHYIESARAATTLLAFSTGIENMRKRRFRTALTLFSLIIMVTSLIVLTSASFYTLIITTASPGQTRYSGLLIRDAEYNPLSEEMARVLEALHKMDAKVSERTWIVEPLGFRIGEGVVADGVLGLSPREDEFVGVSEALVEGRWLEPGDEKVVFISKTLAEQLNKTVGDTVPWLGLDLTIVGIYDPKKWATLTDLDQAYLAPITFEGGYPHLLPADKLLIVPYSLLLRQFNFFPFSIAASFDDNAKVLPSAFNLALQMRRVGVYAGFNGTLTFFNPLTFYGVAGSQFLLVPFIIVAFTVLNVMLASVYERTREIHIFSSLGINPRGITGMFLAESVLFGVVSATLGYLVSMVLIAALNYFHLRPAGLSVNYASTFVVVAVGVTALTALLSTLFPALKASQLATPSLRRRWEIPTSPHGDNWSIPLPFALDVKESGGALLYLGEFVGASTATYGVFAVDPGSISYGEDELGKSLVFVTRLAPFDMSLVQRVYVTAAGTGDTRVFSVNLQRISGNREPWVLANYRFIDALRKQLLVWRALKYDQKEAYVKRAEEAFEKTEKAPEGGGIP